MVRYEPVDCQTSWLQTKQQGLACGLDGTPKEKQVTFVNRSTMWEPVLHLLFSHSARTCLSSFPLPDSAAAALLIGLYTSSS